MLSNRFGWHGWFKLKMEHLVKAPKDGHIYACIDLKSFFASVECAERGLNPFSSGLVVADPDRGSGTVCLAITPALKERGIRNRCRLYEIPLGTWFVTASPRMKLYMRYSVDIFAIYLRFVSPDDVHVYSVDECFIDLTPYLKTSNLTPREFVKQMTAEVYLETGICATVGIGTNLYLAKVALDILAKHAPDCIGILDEELYFKKLRHHQPLTDFWNIGVGIAERLKNKFHIVDMAGIATFDERSLYREFGVNAEFLIDHAHGREPCTIAEIKAYKPQSSSLGNSQVLFSDYDFGAAKIVLKEMVEQACLELIDREASASGIMLGVGFSYNLKPHVNASRKLQTPTDSFTAILKEFESLFEQKIDPRAKIRKLSVALTGLLPTAMAGFQLDLFSEHQDPTKERQIQRTILAIKDRFGGDSIFRAFSLDPRATGRQRNRLVGGHKGE